MFFRILRALLGLSQRDLAEVLKVDHRRVSELENGYRELTSEQAQRLSEAIAERLVHSGEGHPRGAAQ